MTTRDIITSYALWETYVDPNGIDTPEVFTTWTLPERLTRYLACGFDADETVDEVSR